MKRNKIRTLIPLLFVLSACNLGGTQATGYTYIKKYKYDKDFHWQQAVGHPDVRRNYGEHDWSDEKTDVSGNVYHTCLICNCKQYIVEDGSGFSEVTQFTSPVEIHTEYQQKYLAYKENKYDKMPQNSYPDGNKNISDPVFTRIMWSYENHREDLTYSISISQNEDMEDSFAIVGDENQYIDAYNFYLGKNYYRINAIDPFGETHSSKVYSLTVNDVAPRNLYVGARMTNCRDMGGRKVLAGGTIKQGILYRTCGNGYNQDGKKIDDEGKEILLNQLRVKTELNCHNNSSYDFNLTGTKTYATLMDYADGSPSKHHFSRNTESVKNVFEILAKEESYPVYFHCRIGTDRTGLVAILLYGVLGVDINYIYQDYLFSNFGKIGSKRKIGTDEADDISKYITEIQKLPGASFNEQCYNALITIGVPKETINKILDIFIEGEKPNYEKEQVVVAAKDMNIANGTLKTEAKTTLTERNYPSSYVTLANGTTVTATFNVTTAADKQAYIYVGNSDASDSKKIESSISAQIDGKTIVIPQISFKEAVMGNCNGSRVNYYFVKLGDLGNLLSGQHTITVVGVSNNLILGNIAVL